MATNSEKAKVVAEMLAKLRANNAYTIADDPTPFPACYGIDELLKDRRFPDVLALAIANHLRRKAGEIPAENERKTDPLGALEDCAADGLDMLLESVGTDKAKAEIVANWMFNYLFASLACRSKVISDSLKKFNEDNKKELN